MESYVRMPDDALEDFGKLKRDLMSLADRLSQIAEGTKNGSAAKRTILVRDSLEEERFNMAVLGGFKRGKSTFVNALLGRDLLPTGVVPLTSIITKVVFGDKERARIIYLDGRMEEAQASELSKYVTEKGNPANGLRVAEVRVSFNSEKLRDGVIIVDTPGTGSTFIDNTKITREFMEHADAGIFIFSADPPIGESELEFLRLIRKSVERLFFVQNKIDRLSEKEWKEAMEFSASVIGAALDQRMVKVYPLSSKNALEAKLKHEPRLLQDSRFEEFERDLERFLVNGKGGTILHSARTKLLQIAGDLMSNVTLELTAVNRPLEELEVKLAQLKEQNKKAVLRLKEANYLIGGKEGEVSGKLDSDLGVFLDSERGRIGSVLKRRLQALDPLIGRTEYMEAAASEMAAVVAEAMAPFIEEEQTMVSDAFKIMAERFQAEANEIVASVRGYAAEAFEIDLTHHMKGLMVDAKKEFWLEVRPVISFDLFFVGEIESALPRKMLSRFVEGKAVKMIVEELERNAGMFRYELKVRLAESTTRLKQEFQGSLKEAIDAIEGAIVSGITIKQATTQEVNQRASFLSTTSNALEAIIADLVKEDRKNFTS